MASAIKNLNKAVSKVVDEVQATTLEKVFEFVKDQVKDTQKFTTDFEEFKKTLKQETGVLFATTPDSSKKSSSERKKRAPSEYNTFIGTKIKELKEKNADKNGKELMKLAIEAWKARPQQ
jgi:hypothetical protein